MKKIGIIGATGHLGKSVASILAEDIHLEIVALVRDRKKAEKVLPKNIKLVEGDIFERRSLKSFLNQVEYVYLNLSVLPKQKKTDLLTEREGLKLFLEEAKIANIKQIAYISSLVMQYQGINEFNWWVFDIKKQAVSQIKTSGIPYLIFYPSNFMDNFYHVYRKGNKILLAGESKHKMYFIAAQDYAKQVLKAFTIFENQSKEFYIQGIEGFTADEAAAEFIKHHQKEKLQISKAPIFFLKFLGLFIQDLNYASNIIEALNNYPEKFIATETWETLGKPETTLAQFARS